MANSATVDQESAHQIFVAGGTGYIGSHLVSALLNTGHRVAVLVRPGSASKVPPGAAVVAGDPFSHATFVDHITPADTFIQLVGVAHPSPSKVRQFVEVDLRSALESIEAAKAARVRHFIYVSVAHPAPGTAR
jgi:nucleoside-diphosphate-sugar epimerase